MVWFQAVATVVSVEPSPETDFIFMLLIHN